MSAPSARKRDALLVAYSKSIQLFLSEAEAFPRVLIKEHPPKKRGAKRPFSACEILYHMLDVERLWQARIQGLIDGTMPIFQQMDPDKEAEEKHYNGKNYERGLRELIHARALTTELILGMSNDQLELTGVHTRFGKIDTIKILEIMEGHDRQHAAQLERTLSQVSTNR